MSNWVKSQDSVWAFAAAHYTPARTCVNHNFVVAALGCVSVRRTVLQNLPARAENIERS
jgi:hypothetical protein